MNGIENAAKLVALAGSPKLDASREDCVHSIDTPRISFSTTFYADSEFSTQVLDALTALLERGIIRPPKTEVIDGGLEGIGDGLERMRKGEAPSAYRLVARIQDTSSGENRKRMRDDDDNDLQINASKRNRAAQRP